MGAGDGNVTVEMKPLFDQVLATEVSLPATWRLKEQNIPCSESRDEKRVTRSRRVNQ